MGGAFMTFLLQSLRDTPHVRLAGRAAALAEGFESLTQMAFGPSFPLQVEEESSPSLNVFVPEPFDRRADFEEVAWQRPLRLRIGFLPPTSPLQRESLLVSLNDLTDEPVAGASRTAPSNLFVSGVHGEVATWGAAVALERECGNAILSQDASATLPWASSARAVCLEESALSSDSSLRREDSSLRREDSSHSASGPACPASVCGISRTSACLQKIKGGSRPSSASQLLSAPSCCSEGPPLFPASAGDGAGISTSAQGFDVESFPPAHQQPPQQIVSGGFVQEQLAPSSSQASASASASPSPFILRLQRESALPLRPAVTAAETALAAESAVAASSSCYSSSFPSSFPSASAAAPARLMHFWRAVAFPPASPAVQVACEQRMAETCAKERTFNAAAAAAASAQLAGVRAFSSLVSAAANPALSFAPSAVGCPLFAPAVPHVPSAVSAVSAATPQLAAAVSAAAALRGAASGAAYPSLFQHQHRLLQQKLRQWERSRLAVRAAQLRQPYVHPAAAAAALGSREALPFFGSSVSPYAGAFAHGDCL